MDIRVGCFVRWGHSYKQSGRVDKIHVSGMYAGFSEVMISAHIGAMLVRTEQLRVISYQDYLAQFS